MDSSTINLPAQLRQLWPGCGKVGAENEAGLKLHPMLELVSGTLIGPELSPARVSDRSGPHQQKDLPLGALCIADLGYFKLKRFRELAEQGVYFLSKVQTGLKVYDQHSKAILLSKWLGQQDQDTVDQVVEVGVDERLKCRLIARRVPNEVVEQRQAGFKAQVQKRQRPSSAEQAVLTYWNVYITNLNSEHLTYEQAVILYRLRWQIELLFKLWKSLGG